MDVDAQGFVDGLKACFADLKDPRNENSREHLLFDIVAVAVLSGDRVATEQKPTLSRPVCWTAERRRWL
jgi:hypothetical protein